MRFSTFISPLYHLLRRRRQTARADSESDSFQSRCAICFATRPDLHNFLACVTERAPQLAKRKTLLLDRIRVRLAPYIMKVRQPVLYDCGLFSVLTVVDHADYVYVYAGALSRWCLLGWYNVADDYNFDRYLSTSPT
ncbi:hypothetical protein BWQ96_09322 [Gracilariopsis chorda]|uniref:Uncharacterized protein n=1 Tax=Gracilariopsis chorda TaxID=448386 RepID=A0A2V3IFW7_9FLOR|nr:hypothetical protein BWQ96_09322 [Gracilariopsis chorda]|eukprot:PXF40967.1 hypothetical protein BWQ96_09322 [Gracilariopsis chorda]